MGAALYVGLQKSAGLQQHTSDPTTLNDELASIYSNNRHGLRDF